MRHARTIAQPLLFEGVGLHSGERATIRLLPLQDERGIVFRFDGREHPIEEAVVDDTRRSSVLRFGQWRLRTVEHLLAAIVGMELDDVLIDVRGGEVPILDGSALPFAEAIRDAGFLEKEAPSRERALSVPVCLAAGRAVIAALPSDVTRVTYVIDYPGTALGTEMKDIELVPETFLAEIAPARTFGLLSEIEALQREGLAKGGALDNAIIIGDDGPLNTVGYRVERECAAHKALDLIGDLALLGRRVRAHYTCICGGHHAHAKLVDRMKGLWVD